MSGICNIECDMFCHFTVSIAAQKTQSRNLVNPLHIHHCGIRSFTIASTKACLGHNADPVPSICVPHNISL